jgi:hypothetical protein
MRTNLTHPETEFAAPGHGKSVERREWERSASRRPAGDGCQPSKTLCRTAGSPSRGAEGQDPTHPQHGSTRERMRYRAYARKGRPNHAVSADPQRPDGARPRGWEPAIPGGRAGDRRRRLGGSARPRCAGEIEVEDEPPGEVDAFEGLPRLGQQPLLSTVIQSGQARCPQRPRNRPPDRLARVREAAGERCSRDGDALEPCSA